MKSSYLAFDLGASSGRAVLGTLDGERIETQELHRFATPLAEREGHLLWDLAALWAEVRQGLELALEKAPGLRAVSVDSWAVDYVPLDGAGRPLRDAFSYRDPRTRGRLAQALDLVPADELYGRTGIQMLEINTLYQLLSDLDEEPALLRATWVRLPIADYLHYRLSGRAAVERTMASTTQLMDARTGEWAEDLIQRFGLPATGWPAIVAPGTVLGPLALDEPAPSVGRAALATTGAAPLVIAGCSHDTAAAVAAVPATLFGPHAANNPTQARSGTPEPDPAARPGPGNGGPASDPAGLSGARAEGGRWAYLSSGTWSLLGVERAEPLLTNAARQANFTNEAGLDGTVRFLKNLTGLWVLQECERAWEADGAVVDHAALVAGAEAARAPAGLLDLNDPQFAARGDMPARLLAACRERAIPAPETRGELVRLVLDSLAASYGRALDELERVTGERVDVLHVVGGGSQNTLLCQRTADACRRPVVAGPAEATALGNLLVQARTLGDLPPGVSIRDVVRASSALREYQPRELAPAGC